MIGKVPILQLCLMLCLLLKLKCKLNANFRAPSSADTWLGDFPVALSWWYDCYSHARLSSRGTHCHMIAWWNTHGRPSTFPLPLIRKEFPSSRSSTCMDAYELWITPRYRAIRHVVDGISLLLCRVF